jgi:hypothetical protein
MGVVGTSSAALSPRALRNALAAGSRPANASIYWCAGLARQESGSGERIVHLGVPLSLAPFMLSPPHGFPLLPILASHSCGHYTVARHMHASWAHLGREVQRAYMLPASIKRDRIVSSRTALGSLCVAKEVDTKLPPCTAILHAPPSCMQPS